MELVVRSENPESWGSVLGDTEMFTVAEGLERVMLVCIARLKRARIG